MDNSAFTLKMVSSDDEGNLIFDGDFTDEEIQEAEKRHQEFLNSRATLKWMKEWTDLVYDKDENGNITKPKAEPMIWTINGKKCRVYPSEIGVDNNDSTTFTIKCNYWNEQE